MALSCGYEIVHGKCEPAVERDEAREELAALHAAVYDVLTDWSRPLCAVDVWAATPCGKSAAGFVRFPEIGWVWACFEHVNEYDDGDRSIRIVKERS